MTQLKIGIMLILSIVLIVGGYQFYFLPQKYGRNPYIFRPSSLDKMIPFRPGWVWIYSGLYYPVILYLVISIKDFSVFCYTAFNFMVLLALHILITFICPVRTPPDWRKFEVKENISTRFLGLVHRFDKSGNCFPSMHVAVAVLTSIHLKMNLSAELGVYAHASYLFVAIIAASTLYTKQHYVIDIPAGGLLGYMSYALCRPFF